MVHGLFAAFQWESRITLLRLAFQINELVSCGMQFSHCDPILRAFGPGHVGLYRGHIKPQGGGKFRRSIAFVAPHALGLAIGLNPGNGMRITAGEFQVGDRLGVHREEAAGGTVFWCHIRNGGAIGQRKLIQSAAEELHKLANHAMGAQHLYHLQYQVRGGNTLAHLPGQFEAHHVRYEHRDWLPQHGGFRLNTANPPAQHAQAIDHGGMAVCPHQGIGACNRAVVSILLPYHLGEVLQVNLVADTGARGHYAEIVEGTLAPFQELVALKIALHLHRNVLFKGSVGGELVDTHGVINYQVYRRQWVDFLRIDTSLYKGIAHGGQVHHGRDAGEILHQHPCRVIRDFLVAASS